MSLAFQVVLFEPCPGEGWSIPIGAFVARKFRSPEGFVRAAHTPNAAHVNGLAAHHLMQWGLERFEKEPERKLGGAGPHFQLRDERNGPSDISDTGQLKAWVQAHCLPLTVSLS